MSYLGLVGLFLLYGAIGLAVLCPLGLVSVRRLSVWDVPLAVMVGWASLGVGVSFVLVAGGGVRTAIVVASVLSIVSLGAVLRGQRPVLERARGGRVGRVEVFALALLGLICLLFIGKAVFWNGNFFPDVWNIWTPKANSIYFYGGLDTGPSGFTRWVSPDYPPMKPGIDAAVFALGGHADPLLLPVHYALLDVFFLATLLSLFRRRIGATAAAVACAAIAALPGVINLVGSSLGDEALALAIAMAVTLLAVRRNGQDQRFLILTGLFLTSATLLKNEGLMLSLSVIFAAGLSGLVRGLRPLALLAAGPAAATLAWRIWLLAHDVPPNPAYHLSRLLHPIWLIHHTIVMKKGVTALTHQIVSFRWAFIVPACILLGVLLWRDSTRVGPFMVLVLPLWLLGYTAIYWVSVNAWWNAPSENSQRIYAPVAIAAAAITPILFDLLRSRPTTAAEHD